ncbi:hypothetical protein ACHAWF_011713 [Thalassiosira exigua]
MGGGLAFLTKKSFNPANWSNQRQVWEARQKDATEKRRIAEREAQLKREREEEELARVVGGEKEGGRKALGFMYEAGKVPGLERKSDRVDEDDDFGANGGGRGKGGGAGGAGTAPSLYERQPGDDDAAAAFRAMLAGAAAGPPDDPSAVAKPTAGELALRSEADGEGTPGGGPAGKEEDKGKEARDHRTNLEKAVGRGINAGSGVTLAQQMERFPMLKGAPMVLQKPDGAGGGSGEAEGGDAAGAGATNVVGLNFKPLGQVLRNVQCLKCGKWGHARGDRECEMTWDPFAARGPPPAKAPAAPPAPSAAGAVANALPPGPEKPREENRLPPVDEDDRERKKDRRRRKDDRRKKKRRKHKRRRKYDRSPSYSSSESESESDSSSYSDNHERRSRRRREDGFDKDYDDGRRRSRKESRSDGRRSSSRRHEK